MNYVDVFSEVEPNQKECIILSLRKSGNIVGYMGDGINDASALHAADVEALMIVLIIRTPCYGRSGFTSVITHGTQGVDILEALAIRNQPAQRCRFCLSEVDKNKRKNVILEAIAGD